MKYLKSTLLISSFLTLGCSAEMNFDEHNSFNQEIINRDGEELEVMMEEWMISFMNEQEKGKSWAEADKLARQDFIEKIKEMPTSAHGFLSSADH